jgi:alpha-amylase/alpha-mannosidase (GH57 family)
MVRLALLWHMHQPYYEDLATREHILPWVRLHALKDYWGMVAITREFPAVAMTFNLVPSLVAQIEAFAADRARDRHLFIGLKPAAGLEPHEQEFLVAHGFHAQFHRMIQPLPRYAELHAQRAARAPFTVADLRDLQVLHKLAWVDPDWGGRDARVQRLLGKGREYDEADKQALREVELDVLNAVLPAYRTAAAAGRIELSTSPFYHPILPLLCDSDTHYAAHPGSALPRGVFRRPDDAQLQLRRAFASHERVFGARPAGVWPSEGSVSDEVLVLLARCGSRWTATDQEILARSLGRPVAADDLYRPYIVDTAPGIRVLFRDHRLSDVIGFEYQSWDAEAAADDFVQRVRTAGRACAGRAHETPLVTVILDGENAWEHYAGGGRPFLRALYARLETAPDIETVTMSEAAAMPARPLPSIFPGSWINGDFYIWAGHRDDHRAWAQLAAARRCYDEASAAVGDEDRARALEELLIAEGSDWFWWYGDDHSSDHDRDFDELFRRHVKNVYVALRKPVPEELHFTNITTAPAEARPLTVPVLRTPSGAGDYIAWALAAEVPVGGAGGTMHRVTQPLVHRLRIGADRTALAVWIDGPVLAERVERQELICWVVTQSPQTARVRVAGGDSQARVLFRRGGLLALVPFAALGAQAGDRLAFSVLLTDPGEQAVEQQPETGPVVLEVPHRHVHASAWTL